MKTVSLILTNEYFRALSRILIDQRYRNELISFNNKRDDIVRVLKNGGYFLSNDEVDAIQIILLYFSESNVINHINGNPYPFTLNAKFNSVVFSTATLGANAEIVKDADSPPTQVKPVYVVA